MRTNNGARIVTAVLALAGLALVSSVALAQLTPYDTPTITCVSAGENQITVKLCAGASGAPAGLTLQWMPKDLYDALGWLSSSDPRLCALSLSGQPSLQHPGASRWELGPNDCEEIILGDINFDETGVSGSGCGVDPLDCGTEYVFRAFAHAGRRFGRSDFSSNVTCSTLPCPTPECTYTQGYWKNHGPGACGNGQNTNQWPVTSMLLGTVSYTDAQLCEILNTPAGSGKKANGLLTLAHQLIAAKLNMYSGAVCDAVDIASADALIGSRSIPPVGSDYLDTNTVDALVTSLNNFNNGLACAPHCDQAAAQRFRATQVRTQAPWGALKVRYR